jgi:uncharacterized protein (TIGR03792 family)
MKEFNRLKIFLKKYLFLFIFISVLFFKINVNIVDALPMENYQSDLITEELRLKIPSNYKDVWITAEKEIWEPWLSRQDGFLGRQIFWNKDKEEALILVNWENKKLWKSISTQEVNEIQRKFENNVMTSLNVSKNPFQLIYEGELEKEK